MPLTPRQDAVALQMARGRSVKAAARICHVARRTVHYWLELPEFKARVRELHGQLFERAVGRLCGVSAKAAHRLAGLLDSESEKIVLGAAKTVLELGTKFRVLIDCVADIEHMKSEWAALQQRLAANPEDVGHESSGTTEAGRETPGGNGCLGG